MGDCRYRIEQPHDDFEDAELSGERYYMENEQYRNKLHKELLDAGFSYITEVHVSVSVYWYEIMITTEKELTEGELKKIVAYFGNSAHCTASWK